MKKLIKKRWLKALRSGKYKQGRELLAFRADKEEKYGYCCLGVLADIVAKDEWRVSRTIHGTALTLQDSACYLVEKYRYGLTDENMRTLVYMNDTEWKDFKEIADWIEINV